MSKQHQHDGTGPLLDGGHNVGRVPHHSVLILGPRAQKDPGLVLDVENPELTGHVSSGVDLSSVHVDLPLVETKTVNDRGEIQIIYTQSTFPNDKFKEN